MKTVYTLIHPTPQVSEVGNAEASTHPNQRMIWEGINCCKDSPDKTENKKRHQDSCMVQIDGINNLNHVYSSI